VFNVGTRAEYKDPENLFRRHEEIKLKCIPTLAAWKGKKLYVRLEEGQILEEGLLGDLLETVGEK
jgi:hypothetical protein